MSSVAASLSPERHRYRSAVMVCESPGWFISIRVNCEPFLNSVALTHIGGLRNMTPDELSRIREIYERAVSMHGPGRDAFLDEECHGNDELRREVERLLQARQHVPTWLDQPLIGSVRQFVAQPFPNMKGRRLSGYTLIREIGR